MPTPEEKARQKIDQRLSQAGWIAQDKEQMDLGAGLGIAVHEYPLPAGPRYYMLFADRKAAGVIEAKPEARTFTGDAEQSDIYMQALPLHLPALAPTLLFDYESTGTETLFRDIRDPDARSGRARRHRKNTVPCRKAARPAAACARTRPAAIAGGGACARRGSPSLSEHAMGRHPRHAQPHRPRDRADARRERAESERFRRFAYDPLVKRDRLNLDIFWLKDESLEDTANLPPPGVIAAGIVENLGGAALTQFRQVAAALGGEAESEPAPS